MVGLRNTLFRNGSETHELILVKIFLIGFMGVGKSTLGKKLARHLQLPFTDLDQFIEKDRSMSIDQLFSYFGEDFFRKAEHECLLKVMEQQSFVLACGGGTPCYYNNMELMNASGISIYLQAGAGFILSRIRQSPTVRPLLKKYEKAGRDEALRALLEERTAFYGQAKITINVEKLAVDEALQQIRRGIDSLTY
jgi:shikimate kinase